MITLTQLWKEIKDTLIGLIPGLLSLLGFDSGIIFLSSGLTSVIGRIAEYLYQRLFCVNLENEYNASIEIHKYNERKSLNQTYRVVNWYIIKGINDNSIKVQRLVCNESSILDDDYIVRDEAIYHADYTIVPDEDYYVDIKWKDKKFQANHYIIGHKHDNPVYKIYGLSIDDLKEFEEYCLVQHREYSMSIGKDIYKYFEWDLEENEWNKHDIETTKTFENIFIPRLMKEDLKSKIDTFVHAKEFYKRWGIPYKMGLVFHGHPGCGKTSTIYAIANYLGRSIYFMKLDLFQTNHDLLWAAHQIPKDAIVVIEDIDAHKVAHARRPGQQDLPKPIIIRRKDGDKRKFLRSFDDGQDALTEYSETVKEETSVPSVPTLATTEIPSVPPVTSVTLSVTSVPSVTSVTSVTSTPSLETSAKPVTVGEDDETEKLDEVEGSDNEGDRSDRSDASGHVERRYLKDESDEESEDDADFIVRKTQSCQPYKGGNGKGKTIDSLLEIFDGYNYLPGAIVIITTNHLDTIDPAVIRPGRMDHHYLFDYAVPETINDILDFFYVRAGIESFSKGSKDLEAREQEGPSYIDFTDQIKVKPITTAYLINSIILPNIRDRKKAIAILKEKLFFTS